MAKNKTEIPVGLKSAFKALENLNEDANVLSDNALSIVDSYIDTGCYALNAIVSGSLYGGLPKGRIIGFAGPEQCGKTLILNKAIATEQKKDPSVWGVIFDSEHAYEAETVSNVGGDPNRIKHCPVETVEDTRNQISTFLDEIVKDSSLYGKVIIGIDSLGNLASRKEIEDAQKGKSAVDMGMRAKAIKSMMRVLTYKCAKTGTTLIFTNHIYSNPSEMYPSMVKTQAGGMAPLYLASVLVQLSASQTKEEEGKETNEIIPIANKVSGVNLKAMTVKNRFVPPFLKTNMELNFKTGLYKYSGLLDMALAYGIIVKPNDRTYGLADGTKLGYEKNFKNDVELWEKKVLPALDEKLKGALKFSNTNNQPNEVIPIAEDDNKPTAE